MQHWNPHSASPFASEIAEKGSERSHDRMTGNASVTLQRDRLQEVFNTALVTSYAEQEPASAERIRALMSTPAFGAILTSIQLLAGERGISELEAAKEVITTFRTLDRLWADYLVFEGATRF